MTPAELEELRGQTVLDPEKAFALLGVKRTLGYRLLRETGGLCEGVRPIRVGRFWKIPARQVLAVLGYEPHPTPEDRDESRYPVSGHDSGP